MGFEVRITGDRKVFDRIKSLTGLFKSDRLRTVLEDSKNRMAFMANRFAPKRSRALATSILQSSRVEGFGTDAVSIRIGTPLPYGLYQEKGTKPRTYGPETKKVMFWSKYDSPQQRLTYAGAGGKRQRVGAVFSFAMIVHHPGNPAVPFIKPAVEAVRPRLMSAIKRLIKESS
jgi:hypothetical protein